MAASKGNGKAYAWLVEHVAYEGDGCLTFPFCRDKKPGPLGGRGMLGHVGKHYWAHRLMCEMAHGAPPTPKHKACHSCGNGHLGCVNPKHLDWKTQSENLHDMKVHGTQPIRPIGGMLKLNWEQAEYIRKMRGVKTQRALAAEMGISEGAVNDIWRGRKWRHDRKINYWTRQEDETAFRMVRAGSSQAEVAAVLGRSLSGVVGRMGRLVSQKRLSIRDHR